MNRQLKFSKKYDFSKQLINHISACYRVYIYLNLNEYFKLNKFKKAIKTTANDLGIKIKLIENEPSIISTSDCFFIYKRDENKLIFLCSHKYYDGALISYVYKILCNNYNNITTYSSEEKCIEEPEKDDIFDFFKNIIEHEIIKEINKFSDTNTRIIKNMLNDQKSYKLFDYDPKNFNTIKFVEYIQNTTNKTIFLLVNTLKILEEDENTFGNHVYTLKIKPDENVRNKINSIKREDVENNYEILNILKIHLDYESFIMNNNIIFINSLKNLHLPSFVNNIDPLDFLFLKANKIIYNRSYCIMPTDKEGNTMVYYTEK